MAAISRMAAQLSLETLQFTAKMLAAIKPVKRFQEAAGAASRGTRSMKESMDIAATSSQRLEKTFRGLLNVILSFVGVHALTAWFRRSVEDAEKFIDTARDLQIGVQSLQALAFAAKLTKTPFESLSTGIFNMSRNISKANQDGGAAVKTFTQLGLEISELARMKPDAQFQAIAEALQKVTNIGDRNRLTEAIFGKGGRSLHQVIKATANELGNLQAELQRMGIGLTDKDFERIRALGEDTRKLKVLWSGIGTILAAEISPHLDDLVKNLTDSSGAGSELRNNLREVAELFGIAAKAALTIKDAMDVVSHGVSATFLQWLADEQTSQAIAGVAQGRGDMRGVLRAHRGDRFPNSFSQSAAEERAALIESAKSIPGRWSKDKAKGRRAKFSSAIGALGESTDDEPLESFVEDDSLKRAQSIIEENMTAQERFREQFREALKLYKDGKLTAEQYNRAMENYKKQLADATGETARLADEQREIDRIIENSKTDLERYNEEVARLNELHNAGKLTNDVFARSLAMITDEYEKGTEAYKDRQEQEKAAHALIEKMRSPLENYQIEIENINRMWRDGLIPLETYQRALEAANKTLQGDTGVTEMQDRAKSLIDELRTPLEKYQDTLAEINQLWAAGLLPLEMYQRALEKAFQDFGGDTGMFDEKGFNDPDKERSRQEFGSGSGFLQGVGMMQPGAAPTEQRVRVAGFEDLLAGINAIQFNTRGKPGLN